MVWIWVNVSEDSTSRCYCAEAVMLPRVQSHANLLP